MSTFANVKKLRPYARKGVDSVYKNCVQAPTSCIFMSPHVQNFIEKFGGQAIVYRFSRRRQGANPLGTPRISRDHSQEGTVCFLKTYPVVGLTPGECFSAKGS